jgi:hypothetical protein
MIKIGDRRGDVDGRGIAAVGWVEHGDVAGRRGDPEQRAGAAGDVHPAVLDPAPLGAGGEQRQDQHGD